MYEEPQATPPGSDAAQPLAAAGCAFAAAAFLSMGRVAIDSEPDTALGSETLAIAALSMSAAVACIALCAAFAQRARLGDALGLHRPRASVFALALLACGLLGLSILAKAAVMASGAYDGSALETIDGAIAPESASAALALVIAVAIAPGIAEELLFRGAVFGALARRFGPGACVVLSALLFGAFHIDPAHIAGAIPLGLYLGAVRAATGSTLAAIVCHVLNNGIAIAISAASPEQAQVFVIVGLSCLGFAAYWLFRHWPRAEPSPVATPEADG